MKQADSALPTTAKYVVRGFGYWFVSFMSLWVGNISTSGALFSSSFPALVALSFATLPFFVIYPVVFDLTVTEYSLADLRAVQKTIREFLESFKRDSILVSVVLAVLIPTLIWLSFKFSVSQHQLGYIVLYLSTFYFYGHWLAKSRRKSVVFKVRHEIFLSVLLVICLNVHTGAQWIQINSSSANTLAIIVAILYFGIISAVCKRPSTFFTASIFIFLGALAVFLLSFLDFIYIRADIMGILASAIYSFVVGVYLSGLELWRTTALVARLPQRLSILEEMGEMKTMPTGEELRGMFKRYYESSYAALIAMVLIFPIVYVIGPFGIVFFVFVSLHSLLSLIVWSVMGEESYDRRQLWTNLKLFFGFVFLVILLIDSIFPIRFRVHPFTSDFSNLPASLVSAFLLGIFALASLRFGQILRMVLRDGISGLKRLLRQTPTKNYIYRVGSSVAATITFIMIFSVDYFRHSDPYIAGKMTLALCFYFILSIGFLLVGLWNDGGRNMPRIGPTSFLIGLIQTTRIITSAMVFSSVYFLALRFAASQREAILLSVPLALIAMGGFALNDYFDLEKDKINAPHRALPSGRLDKPSALTLGIVLLTTGIIVSALVNYTGPLIVTMVALASVVFYNELVRICPSLKTVVTAGLCVSPLIYSIYAFNLPSKFWLVALACYIFVLGREILMDIRDMPGDKAVDVRTTPQVVGVRMATQFAIACFILSSVILGTAIRDFSRVEVVVLGVLYILSIVLSMVIWYSSMSRGKWYAIEIMKAPFVLGVGIMVFM